MRSGLITFLLAAGVAALGPALPTQAAALSTFKSSTSFLTALGAAPTLTETYEGFPLGTVIAPGATFNGITYNSFPTAISGGLVGNQFSFFDSKSLEAERDGVPGGGPQDFFFPG